MPEKNLIILDCTLPKGFDIARTIDFTEQVESYCASLSFMETGHSFSVRMITNNDKMISRIIKKIAPTAVIKSAPIDLDTNWLLESYNQFPPLNIKEFFIYGSHYTGAFPKEKIPLVIDAATAFGSGEHGTTKGCVEALSLLKSNKFKPKTILDMGTGSGILALAAYSLWRVPTLAIDNDKESVRVACRHRKMNKIPSGDKAVTCAYGDGFAARRVKQQAPFDLIIANILAAPLIDMAEIAVSALAPKGRMILSGILKTQAAAVKKAYRAQGLKPLKIFTRGEWVTMILSR